MHILKVRSSLKEIVIKELDPKDYEHAQVKPPEQLNIIPEYDMPLSHVTLVIAPRHNFFMAQLALIKLMPSTTHVTFLGRSEQYKHYQKEISALPNTVAKLVIHEFMPPWFHDMTLGDDDVRFTTLNVGYTYAQVFQDLRYGKNNLGIRAIAYDFEAGNVLPSRHNGQVQYLVGKKCLVDSRTVKDLRPTAEEYSDLMQQTMSVKASILAPNIDQHHYMYHLDMFMMPLKDGVIGILDPESIGETFEQSELCERALRNFFEYMCLTSQEVNKIFTLLPIMGSELACAASVPKSLYSDIINGMRSIIEQYNPLLRSKNLRDVKVYLNHVIEHLKALGFEIVLFKTHASRVLLRQTNMNTIVWQGNMIMPTFGKSDGHQDIDAHNKQLFEQYGFKVTTFEDNGCWWLKGGPRCFFARCQFKMA